MLRRAAWLKETYGDTEEKNRSAWEQPQSEYIVLFDLDGTLTEPRQEMNNQIIPTLKSLSEIAEIGIVTGSDYKYLTEQVDYLISKSSLRYRLHLLPCNGTKYYRPPKTATDKHELCYESNMRDRIGEEVFSDLMSYLIGRQARIRYCGIPLTGHFVDYRGSMINWCPIGRNANKKERKYFVDYDMKYEVRSQELKSIKKFLSDNNYIDLVTIKLGGNTSFDIYPKGWDKTYCLKHFQNKQHYFIGDRCKSSGNDHELYKYLNSVGRAFETTGPFQTECIIRENIIPMIKREEKDEKKDTC